MKKIFAVCLVFHIAIFAASGPTEQSVLVSHTRSGRHWFEYSMKELTGKPVKWFVVQKNSLFSPKKSLWCSHSPRLKSLLSDITNRLIVPLRNYKELILRHTRHLGEQELLEALRDPKYYQNYLVYLRYYDSWNEDTRLFYY